MYNLQAMHGMRQCGVACSISIISFFKWI